MAVPGLWLANAVLGAHLLVIAFNVAGLIAIPVGARLGWSFVRARGWRLLHVLSWSVVAVQAVAGRACFLTLWQDRLTGGATETPLVMRMVNRVIFWPLPTWAFAAIYLAAFGYVIALLWITPVRSGGRRPGLGSVG
jgi:hypothetical protein